MLIKHGDIRGPLLPLDPGLATLLPQVYGTMTMELSSVTLGSGVWCHHTMRGEIVIVSYPILHSVALLHGSILLVQRCTLYSCDVGVLSCLNVC